MAVVTAVAGTVFIAAGAFWLSFTALRDLARRSGVDAGEAWAWPLIVDGIIVVATVAVVAVSGQRSAWYPWVLLIAATLVSVTANAMHAVVAADADVPAVLAAAVASVPPLVLLAITHLTVILTRSITPIGETSATHERAASAGPAPTAASAARQLAAVLRGQGWSNKAIARQLEVHPSTVGRWFATIPPLSAPGQEDE